MTVNFIKVSFTLSLAFFHSRGGGGQGRRPLRQFAPPENFCPLPEIWSENNSITKEICIIIDFAPEKNSQKKAKSNPYI